MHGSRLYYQPEWVVGGQALHAPLQSDRLRLEPLSIGAADRMVEVLADPALYEFTGGDPPSLPQLRERYRRQSAGRSPDGAQLWCNWIVHRRQDGETVGTVQATVDVQTDQAEVAWVIGTGWQGRGYAREAARTLLMALRDAGISRVIAHVHPDHQASQAVSRHLGMRVTGRIVDGEQEWAVDLAPVVP
ncbi:GNAT family N-acetyltransferase [Leekyejoonella antrihumi]|uniref:GNAT family N-acetyltransferase n=1 Tax=Leekyejoonella antrihumi TaxID=1660198 RepID=A0A563DUG9_9MICO|nr:GNAT family N-acetyltransferase [Leekyejoonella antrihumi]TWP33907.1 GNAT family N-acetyltransferase [Leekyejoonella antrihumi]